MQKLDDSILFQIMEKYNWDSSAIISILNEIQKHYDYLPFDALKYISKELNVPLSKINGIITFYANFTTNKPGKYKLRACHGTACFVKGANPLTDTLETEFGIVDGKTTEDGLFTLEVIACLGACAIAPVIEINGEVHGEMDPKKLKRLIKSIKRKEGVQ